jgi:hypothetical protein
MDVRNGKTQQTSKALLQVAGGNTRDLAIVMLFLQTGLRVSELVNLKLMDIDFTSREITVRQGKGRKDRVVPLVKQAEAALKAYLKVRDAQPEYDEVFIARNGTSMVSVHRGLSIMCIAMLSLSSEPTMPIRRSELHPERWATLVGYGNGSASGHRQHDLAFSLFATGLGANPSCGPGPCADAPNSTARAATAASPAPTPGRYAARAAG